MEESESVYATDLEAADFYESYSYKDHEFERTTSVQSCLLLWMKLCENLKEDPVKFDVVHEPKKER